MPGDAIIEKNNFGNSVRINGKILQICSKESWEPFIGPTRQAQRILFLSSPLAPLIVSSQSIKLMFVKTRTSASIGNKRTQRRRKVKKLG